jgi:hypothetical protein
MDLLYTACQTDNLEVLKTLVNRDNLNDTDADSQTPLESCAMFNSPKCLLWLLDDMKADIKDALFFAVNDESIECVRILLQYGADVNARPQYDDSDDYDTLLEIAFRQQGVIECLLEYNPDVSVFDTLLREEHGCRYPHEIKNLFIMMDYGVRLPQEMHKTHKYIVRKYSLFVYQETLDAKYKRCVQSAKTLSLVLLRNRIPRDVRKQICNKLVLPTWLDDKWLPKRTRKLRIK